MNTAADVADVGKAMMLQKRSNLHASTAVMAQASDRAIFVQFEQTCRHRLHRHDLDITTRWRNAGQLALPGFANVQDQGLSLRRSLLKPVFELSGTNLLHG